MSTDQWERGTIIIPTSEWAAFRRGLIETWNKEQERLFVLAQKMRGEVDAAAKGKRGFNRVAWLREKMQANGWGENGESERHDDCDSVIHLVGLQGKFADGAWTTPTKTHAPKRKDLKLMPVSRGGTMHADQGTIVLNDETHSVTWSVSENNHACDTARSMPIARALFAALNRITWTRGSGGKIIGNDEYNRDGDEEGAGGNYVTSEYGPDVQKKQTSTFSPFTYAARRY